MAASSDFDSSAGALPSLPPGLIERTAERAWVIDVIRESSSPIVLQGLGGAGKTCLAIDVAHALLQDGRVDAVVWATARDKPLSAESFLRATARRLDARELAESSLETLPGGVQHLLAERPPLLVIDNFETIGARDQADILTFLTTLSPLVRILITSRDANFMDRLPGARLKLIGGMTIDETRRLVSSEAVKVGATFLEFPPPSVVKDFRNATNGLPIALCWLVAQCRLRPLGAVLAEVASAPPGELGSTLFQWSYALLDKDARGLLQAACVLEGSVSLFSLAAVSGSTSALDVGISKLRQLGLIEERGVPGHEGSLFGVHPLVRGFVRGEIKREAGLEDVLLGRALRHYVRFVDGNGGFQDAEGHERIDSELPAILALVNGCYHRQDWSDLLYLERPLNNLFWLRGYMRERLNYGRMAREAAAQLEDDWTEGDVLSGDLAWTHLQLGELDESERCLMDAFPVLESGGNIGELVSAWRYLAQVAHDRYLSQGDIVQALRVCGKHLAEAWRVAADLPEWQRAYARARVQVDLGYLALEADRLDDAESAFTEAEGVFAERDDDVRRAFALNGLGDLCLRRNDPQAARALYAESLDIARRLRSRADEGRATMRLARALSGIEAAGGLAEATEARAVFHEMHLAAEEAEADELIRRIAAGPPLIRLDCATGRAWIRGKEVHFPPLECTLLERLYRSAGKVCSHKDICSVLFPGNTLPIPELMHNVFPIINHLRHAIQRDPKNPVVIVTKFGAGYRLAI